jgi:hypothetical protein
MDAFRIASDYVRYEAGGRAAVLYPACSAGGVSLLALMAFADEVPI